MSKRLIHVQIADNLAQAAQWAMTHGRSSEWHQWGLAPHEGMEYIGHAFQVPRQHRAFVVVPLSRRSQDEREILIQLAVIGAGRGFDRLFARPDRYAEASFEVLEVFPRPKRNQIYRLLTDGYRSAELVVKIRQSLHCSSLAIAFMMGNEAIQYAFYEEEIAGDTRVQFITPAR